MNHYKSVDKAKPVWIILVYLRESEINLISNGLIGLFKRIVVFLHENFQGQIKIICWVKVECKIEVLLFDSAHCRADGGRIFYSIGAIGFLFGYIPY